MDALSLGSAAEFDDMVVAVGAQSARSRWRAITGATSSLRSVPGPASTTAFRPSGGWTLLSDQI
ncbi:hypothetical protein GCM10010260_74010 [Streptomyces filipinensis]|uniref:Uncharacterized protein n=1 Tax=Streptomyces filipinensis TaxID=66887 RepID=A0A918IIR5_9ACTN|nr:hypothetical protein GCM10010260_74010 [Streptomyces filipinensis]